MALGRAEPARWFVWAGLIGAAAACAGQAPPIDTSEHDVADRAATVQWLAAHAKPLRTVEPTGDHSDLDFLHDWIGKARIVALGEATHGTREFFQLKHRIFRHLVEREGFTAIAFEAGLPEAMDIDRYIQTGEGDPRSLLAQLYWTWNTQEVLDLIKWMRTYNADSRHARKIHFYGFDPRGVPDARDREMAQNADLTLAGEGKDGRIVLWAHNYHVGVSCEPVKTMGCFLRSRHDRNDLFILGFAFNRGGFQARAAPFPADGALKTFDVAPAPPDSLDGTLAQTGIKLFAINLREIPADGPVAAWMARPHLTRNLGALYDTSAPEQFFLPLTPPGVYDALLFVETTTAARRN